MKLIYLQTDKSPQGDVWVDPSSIAAIHGCPNLYDQDRDCKGFPHTTIVLKNGEKFNMWMPLSKVLMLLGFEQSPHLDSK